jgi:hypothetical protein
MKVRVTGGAGTILRMATRPKKPTLPGRLYDFCTVNPTKDLEVGFTRSSIWAGVGHPFTFDSLLRNFGSISSPLGESSAFGNRNDPGDRKSGFDFSYRVPVLRNWRLFIALKIIKARFRRARIKRNERWTTRQKFKASQSRSAGAGLYQISGVLVDAVRGHPLQAASRTNDPKTCCGLPTEY